eukprot:m.453291 g.453291  ORF g.453291 m.453291 type:complete len:151 (-) comp20473_c0_seq1:145-597(-)
MSIDALPSLNHHGIIAIVASGFTNFVMVSLWYTTLFSDLFVNALSVDKAIKKKDFEKATNAFPVPFEYRLLSSFFCHLLRAYCFWVVFELTRVQSVIMAVFMAVAMYGGSMLPSAHHHVWEGRPHVLTALTFANELASTILSAVIVKNLM